jgi:hypothetical protein
LLPAWATVFTYSEEFSHLGSRAKQILRENRIQFKVEFDRVVGVYLIRVRGKDLDRANRLLAKEIG